LQLAAAGASVAVNYAGNQAAADETVRAIEAALITGQNIRVNGGFA